MTFVVVERRQAQRHHYCCSCASEFTDQEYERIFEVHEYGTTIIKTCSECKP